MMRHSKFVAVWVIELAELDAVRRPEGCTIRFSVCGGFRHHSSMNEATTGTADDRTPKFSPPSP